MTEPAAINYDKSYKIMLQTVLVFNVLYYINAFNISLGVFDLMPMPIDTKMGLAARIPFVYYAINCLLILNCLFISLRYFTIAYLAVLLIELVFYLTVESIMTMGYSWGQTTWGVVVLMFYLLYLKHEPKPASCKPNAD